MRPILLAAAVSTAAAAPGAELRSFTEEIAGAAATIQVDVAGPEHDAFAKEAADLGFASLRAALEAGEGAGAGCDAALAALASADLPRAIVVHAGAAAAGEPPQGAPGWMMSVGFRTPGYPTAMLPLARRGYAGVAPPGHPLRVAVVAQSAADAERLAREVHGLGRREGRARIDREPRAELFLEDARFRPLFDGRSLAGWTARGGRYDGNAVWTAERGSITGRLDPAGEGGLLYTEERFTAFELELETKLDYPFDSGVFVRMLPREEGDLKGAQVTLDHRDDGEIAAIYSDGWLRHNAEGKKLFERDGWNHLELRCTGFDLRVEVWLNGVKTMDYELPPDGLGFASEGRIGLQVHGGEPGEQCARFRNLRIRELPVFGDEGDAKGWEVLQEGGDLSKWERHGVQEGYRAADGVLSLPASGDGHLFTTADYRDFRLALDFKIERMANSGVFLRAARDGSNPAFSGCEIQILDDFHWESDTGTSLAPWQFTGSLYGAVAPRVQALKPLGEWNSYELQYRGSRLAVALNGKLLYDVDTADLEPASGPPFAERAHEGAIGLQVHPREARSEEPAGDAPVSFRGIRVQRL